ncbi:MBL fold metallo-hydrolase [Raoultella planticola]|nr:MBL fold metallo-hydrolase [Raoultella planticola]MCQ6499728.1 MBL fold metallo-hydrolase [Raoultella planticola]
MMLKMTMLVENHLSSRAVPGMQPCAGLCILLDDGDSRILFDTGPDETFIRNARLMNEPLSNLSAVVLSHGHYDHIGGVNWLNSGTRIICHPDVVRERYACVRVPGKAIPVKKLTRHLNFTGENVLFSKGPHAVGKRFTWTGEIPVEKPVAYGVTDVRTGALDYVPDEGALIWRSSRGLVIITGCGHRGLENTIRHCRNITREENIYAVIGGLHLRTASPLKLINLMKFLREIKPEKIMGCHCTGRWGRLWLKDKYRLSCGDTLFFDA